MPQFVDCVISRMGREDVGGKPWQVPIPEQNDHGNGNAWLMKLCSGAFYCNNGKLKAYEVGQ